MSSKFLVKTFLLTLLIAGIAFAQNSSPTAPVVHVIQLEDDMVNPITAEYISRAIDRAVESKAQCLVIKLDTPGGLLTSTRQIVRKILAADVPVIVYVAPSGARAGSAGVFITYASHIAAMAPSTNIGAAHPVELGGQKEKDHDAWQDLKTLLEKTQKENSLDQPTKTNTPNATKAGKDDNLKTEDIASDQDPLKSKILQDTVAFVKTLAQKRNRNAEWAVKSVVKSASITEQEALSLKVIDLIAQDETELFKKIHGRTVQLNERTVTLNTESASVKRFTMDARQKFFNVLANPNIAYILMILGFYGLLYEITHPGFGMPGVLGTIFLILSFFSMQTLPTNYAGLALIILGLTLFVVEAFVAGFGLLTFGGLVSMFIGSLLLFDGATSMMRVSLTIIIAFTTTTAAITLFLVRAVIMSHRRKVRAGEQGMVGEIGEVYKAIPAGGEGKVFVHGEIWNATASEALTQGEKIIVTSISGLTVKVGRKSSAS